MVSRTILLDTGPLGLLSHPNPSAEGIACNKWVEARTRSGARFVIPEIADYELRRELMRANKVTGLRKLNVLAKEMRYLPITTAAMRQAAAFWAIARKERRQTADDKALDGDVILAAQAVTLRLPGAIIATTNVGHLTRFAPAAVWRDIDTGEP